METQSKDPDIYSLSLCVSTEDLLSSFNTQDQTPDDPYTYTQDRQCAPFDFVENPLHGIQVLARLLTKDNITSFPFQLVSQNSTQELIYLIK